MDKEADEKVDVMAAGKDRQRHMMRTFWRTVFLVFPVLHTVRLRDVPDHKAIRRSKYDGREEV